MKKLRRTELSLLLLLALLPSCPAHGAQERRTPQTKAKQSARRDARERERRERQQAAAAVNEAVASSPEIKDSYKRSLLLAHAADALWTFDEQAARSIFMRAWQTAVASDEEESERFEKSLRERAQAEGSPVGLDDLPEFFTPETSARREVLAVASRHDARLTERYLAEFRESFERGKGGEREEAERPHTHLGDASSSILNREQLGEGERMRLALSQALFEGGDYRQAAAVAAGSFEGGVNAALIKFLLDMRRDAPAEADALYRQLLARAAANPRAGVNDVLLLSTYALNPNMLVWVYADGSVGFSDLRHAGESDGGAATPVPRAVRLDFFNTAAAVLLRASMLRPAVASEARARAVALFFATARLLPFFEREAPQLAPQLNALRQSAAAELEAPGRDSLAHLAETASLTPSNPIDPLEPEFEYAKKLKAAAERDAARQRAVRQAVKLKLWARAREAINGMEDAELREDSLSLLAVCQVAAVGAAFEGDEDGDERAAQFVERADVPPLTRALGYAQAALLASKLKKPGRAVELLERARTFAEQTDAGLGTRFVALLVVATAAEQADPPRAWAILPALVRAANEVEAAPADELVGGYRLPGLEGAEEDGLAEQLVGFRLDDLCAALARRDFPRTLREARAVADVTLRSLITVSAARARLATQERAELLRRGAK